MRDIDRRSFMKLGVGAWFAGCLPDWAGAAAEELKPKPIRVEVGTKTPFKALHVSDTHLALMTEKELEDPCRAKLYADRSGKTFPGGRGTRWLAAALAYARARGELVLHTGDLIDFIGDANLEAVKRDVSTGDVFCANGNHEWCYHMYTKSEDCRKLREQYFARVQAAYPNALDVASRVHGGVNFVSFDNWDYRVTQAQWDAIRREFDRGLPVVLMCHCPFYTPKLHEESSRRANGKGSYVMSAPPEEVEKFGPAGRWQLGDELTFGFYHWAKAQKNLRAILAGHLHFDFSERFSPTAVQHVVGANCNGCAAEIEFA